MIPLAQIASCCKESGPCLVGQIPYESKVVEALMNRMTVMDYPCNGVQEIVRGLWKEIKTVLKV
jgi:hypothetical protein